MSPSHGVDLEFQGDGMADESSYRGSSVRELPKANRTFGSGRVCAAEGCSTKLSMYNKWDFCWQHEPVHEYVPRGKRKRKEAA
jgi:hypothetical protein